MDLPRAPIVLDTGTPPKCSRSRQIRVVDALFRSIYRLNAKLDSGLQADSISGWAAGDD